MSQKNKPPPCITIEHVDHEEAMRMKEADKNVTILSRPRLSPEILFKTFKNVKAYYGKLTAENGGVTATHEALVARVLDNVKHAPALAMGYPFMFNNATSTHPLSNTLMERLIHQSADSGSTLSPTAQQQQQQQPKSALPDRESRRAVDSASDNSTQSDTKELCGGGSCSSRSSGGVQKYNGKEGKKAE